MKNTDKYKYMIGREPQITQMTEALSLEKSSFMAVTGRRRVGKTYLIDQVYAEHICLRVTGIQGGDLPTQLFNFTQKLAEQSNKVLVAPKKWQEVFVLLKNYLKTLPTTRKQVIFLDELPWINTSKSGFIQLLAHFWNDYLSKNNHFILVICGSSTSWIHQKIVNDRGGFHNRLTHRIHLKSFTLKETKQFFLSKNIHLSPSAIAELYMVVGGIPFYLEQIRRGESPTTAIERLCFAEDSLLKNEYDNLYKAIFDSPANHEAIVEVLATSKEGLTRDEILQKAKVNAGGPYQRAIEDLMISGFVSEVTPFSNKKKGSVYRLVDEYSVFYHRFIKPNRKAQSGAWPLIAASQAYKVWVGLAFETLCLKHIQEIKNALGIANVYTQTSSFRHIGNAIQEGFQIDILIDRKDASINICECKFYESPLQISKKYALQLLNRKSSFKATTQTRKIVFNTLITNLPIHENEYALQAIDVKLTLDDLM